MAKYDVESFLTNVKTVFQSNLNTKITELNTEKGDFDIDQIPTDAWYINHIPKVWSYNTFIVWGISDIPLSNQQPGAAIQTVNLFIEACVQDKGYPVSESVIYQLLRYSRALLEVANENFDKLQGYGKLQLDSLSPSLVDISGKRIRMSGINLSASFDV